jgi:ectoine hydroxylase-related dioxygenase (phytanoyl-CoA dioxygenase family)
MMKQSNFKSYGIAEISQNNSLLDLIIESLEIKGYFILEDFLSHELTQILQQEVVRIYQLQCQEISEENLKRIKEQNLVRAPLIYSEILANLVVNEFVMAVMKKTLGSYFSLHLQNAIINTPSESHHQSSWHRDLPYQNFVSSVPLAMNAFYCITPFNAQTGATIVLPYSHHLGKLPSMEYIKVNSVQIEAKAGAVIFFNSMLFHCAGFNSSDNIRIGINHVYTTPIIKQQIDLPTALEGKYADDPIKSSVLGYPFVVTSSVSEYRNKRLERIK